MLHIVYQYTKGFIHLFYPRICEACSKPLIRDEDVLCLGCEAHLSLSKYHAVTDNETIMRLGGRFPFHHATSFAYFNEENILQHLLHQLKYKGKQNIGIYLGKQLGHSLKPLEWEVDAIISVPLHKKKQTKRGFNQSDLIAEGISNILKVPLLDDVIERVKNTSTQTDKSRQQRIDNMKDAFKLTNKTTAENKHVLLVDDVLTTGATIEACALELLKCRNIKLSIATIGIAT